MKREREYEFCMSQFKPAIAVLSGLLVVILVWTGWHCTRQPHAWANLSLAAAISPTAPPIGLNDKMLHPYWGNCSKCHVTTGVGKPVSQVMTGPPISIQDKMLHDYWGNCLLCHEITDGIPPQAKGGALVAAANRFTAQSVGLELQTVRAATMQKFGLANEDGVLVLSVTPNSPGARSGLEPGDEIVRAGKVRLDTTRDFDTALGDVKPGAKLKLSVFRGKKSRNLFLRVPKGLPGTQPTPVAATTPMTQNQVETLAEQLGVPKTQQAVTQALNAQNSAVPAAATPMTQNQVETLAEQLGVPKTQQAVTQALNAQNRAVPAAQINISARWRWPQRGPGSDIPSRPDSGRAPTLSCLTLSRINTAWSPTPTPTT